MVSFALIFMMDFFYSLYIMFLHLKYGGFYSSTIRLFLRFNINIVLNVSAFIVSMYNTFILWFIPQFSYCICIHLSVSVEIIIDIFQKLN